MASAATFGMAADNQSPVVGIFTILLLAMLGAFIAWQTGAFGSGVIESRTHVHAR